MKLMKLLSLVVGTLLLLAAPVLAAPGDAITTPVLSGSGFGAGIGEAITIIGAGWGFGRIGASALESMARQPEVAGRVQTGMIVIAALLEGATFFALVICIILTGKAVF